MCLDIVPFGLSSSTAKIAPIMTPQKINILEEGSMKFSITILGIHAGSGYPAFVVVQCKSFHIVFVFHSSDHL